VLVTEQGKAERRPEQRIFDAIANKHLALTLSILGLLFICLRAFVNTRFDLAATKLLIGITPPSVLLSTALIQLVILLLPASLIVLWIGLRFWDRSWPWKTALLVLFISACTLVLASSAWITCILVIVWIILANRSARKAGRTPSGRQLLLAEIANFENLLNEWREERVEDEKRLNEMVARISENELRLKEASRTKLLRRTLAIRLRATKKALDARTPWARMQSDLDQLREEHEKLVARREETHERHGLLLEKLNTTRAKMRTFKGRLPDLLGLRISALLFVTLLLAFTLMDPWTARENVRSNNVVIDGYVIGTAADQTLILKTEDRSLVWVASKSISQREVCIERSRWYLASLSKLFLTSSRPTCALEKD
jgi:hypothetical protein